jgi:hypothetical protein
MSTGIDPTVAGPAGRAGIDARYAREWLEQQAVAGFLDVEPATVRRWSEQAGFAELRTLPVDHLFWRFYQLRG